MKEHLVYLLWILLALQFSCDHANEPLEFRETFETTMLDTFESERIPAMAVLIFKEDSIIYERYLGSSNLEQNQALESSHPFLLASISKVITATALLQLVENNQLELDDSINESLPFRVEVPEFEKEITFRMLLTHTSGIADNDSVLDLHYFYNQDSPISLNYFMENYFSSNGEYYDEDENFLGSEPGTEHAYSNVASALIGLLVEQISNLDFNTYCKENIFLPLGMSHTSWRLDELSVDLVVPYELHEGEHTAIDHYTNTDYPNGGLRSTPRDMFIFLSTIALGGKKSDVQLLQPETIQLMLTPHISALDESMGLHWFNLNPQYTLWGHDGGEQGVSTIMGFNPSTKVGSLIFTNLGEVDLDHMFSQAYLFGVDL